jgi:hypothetical protein
MVVSITTLVEKGGCVNNVTFEKARSVQQLDLPKN